MPFLYQVVGAGILSLGNGRRKFLNVKRKRAKTQQGNWRVWAELLRLPNLFTVPGDILAGWCLSGQRGAFPVLAILASLALYAAGLLLNDCFDASIDARERPKRPIPSGRVGRFQVFSVACLLAVMGVLCAGSGVSAAIILLGLILFYDLLAKHLPWIGVLTMGCCRGMNVYLGAACAWPSFQTPCAPLLILAMLFFTSYIVLVSVIAKREAEPGAKVGAFRFLAPLFCIGLVPILLWFDRGWAWPPLVVSGLMMLFLVRKHSIPALVAGLIRFLIPLQWVWCLVMYPSQWIGFTIGFAGCWAGAWIASRRFAGS